MKKFTIGMLLFPDITLLDFIGPYEVFVRANCFKIVTVSEYENKNLKAEGGFTFQADHNFSNCPAFDILFIPGGRGITSIMTNESYLDFIRSRASHAEYITSVCTGSLMLAAAGLLNGYSATTHWRSIPLLKMFGIDVPDQRVVKDRNRITGGGVTSGIDFALQLVSSIGGIEMAKGIQLMLEYTPEPPFNCGNVNSADSDIVETVKDRTEELFNKRQAIISSILNRTS